MTAFLSDLKADLLDRRMLPLLALAAAALLAAIAYVAFGSSKESGPAGTGAHAAVAAQHPSLNVTLVRPESAVAETTSGAYAQHHGPSRDPFAPLPASQASQATGSSASGSSSSSSASAGASSSGGGGSSSSSSGSSTSSSGSSSSSGAESRSSSQGNAAPKKKQQPRVDALFGETQPGVIAPVGSLKRYEGLKLGASLPSSAVQLFVYEGVQKRAAEFKLAGEAILRGEGVCAPSEFDCEKVLLKAGQHEQAQYLPSGSETPVTYELRVVSINGAG